MKTKALDKFWEVVSEIPHKRHPLVVLAQNGEETGELNTEVMIKTGFKTDKVEGPDGVLGEACDQIITALDLIWLLGIYEDEEDFFNQINDKMVEKLEKWRSKYE